MSYAPKISPGTKFTNLTVVNYLPSKKAYHCVCICGNEVFARSYALKTGRTKSCRCYIRKLAAENSRKSGHEALVNFVYKNYSKSASRRGYEFLIDKKQFEVLIFGNCYYCGQIPNMKFNGTPRKVIDTTDFLINGVDRIDNNIGYSITNCVSCCKICNNAKASLKEFEWREWISRVYNHLFKSE